MEAVKKQRKSLRAAFTKAYNSFLSREQTTCSREDKIVAFQLLETKAAELDIVQAACSKALFQSQATEKEIAKEIDADDEYKVAFLTAKLKAAKIMEPPIDSVSTGSSYTVAIAPRKTLKLPSIELPKFRGSVKEWLSFWSIFKKIHEDSTIRREDKFQYLIQATVPDSRAHDLVRRFPPPSTAENYEKAVISLKNRFGQDDIVVEYYVRELLSLVLQNAVKEIPKVRLATIYDKLEAYIRALDTLGVTTEKCAAMLYPLVESALPEEILRAWQRNGSYRTVEAEGVGVTKDKLTKLLDFLQIEVESQERIDMALQGFGLTSDTEKTKKTRGVSGITREVASASALLTTEKEKQVVCIFCKSSHESKECVIAKKMDMNERKECLKKENACFVCLKRGHLARFCRVRVKCTWCSKRHELLFCPGLLAKEDVSGKEVNKKIIENNLAAICETPEVYLQTLRVVIYSDSREITVRAIIDTGSSRSYVRTDVVEKLGYAPGREIEVMHSLFGGIKSKVKKHNIFKIRLKNINQTYACNFSVLGVETICKTIPHIKKESWLNELLIKNIHLTDGGCEEGTIDVLIGSDVAGKLITGNKYDLTNGLTALETSVGWTVMRRVSKGSDKSENISELTSMLVQEADPSELWRLDVLGIADPIETENETTRNGKVRQFILDTAKFTNDGRYEVMLPWKENHVPLPSNYDIARQRLGKTVEKLNSNDLFSDYNEIFKKWLSEKILEKVPENEISHTGHYLPHRPVIKDNSTTRIRPVFDASARRRGHPSLNQCLEKGPNLMELVPSSLNRFREKKLGVISDIKGAFLQIGVNELDRNYLRFLWFSEGKVITFRHCRVVFGLSCSPFLLSAIIARLLEEALFKAKSSDKFFWTEKSVRKLKESFYVDNCVTSVDSAEELQIFIEEATAMMAMGGFELRGWETSGEFSESDTALVLGISWNKSRDTISVNPKAIEIKIPDIVTKRSVLSVAHGIFDPIGFTSPILLQPKLLFEQLCQEKVEWDTAIDKKRENEILKWANDLKLLKEIEISRHFGEGGLTLHAFGDASKLAYAAVVFARVETEDSVLVTLVSAKARIAPENATIPRLELMAAAITARLAKSVVESLTRPIERITFWSDSTTVLAWLKRENQWGLFVHNRVKEIRSLSDVNSWKYVPSEYNPADLPSRGCSPSQLVESKWWEGPRWLRENETQWPFEGRDPDENEIRSEMKKTAIVTMVNAEEYNFDASKVFPTYTKLIRFIAWVRRFLQNRRTLLENRRKGEYASIITYTSIENRKNLSLSFRELKEAEVSLLKHLQKFIVEGRDGNKLSSFRIFKNDDDLIVLKTKIVNREDSNLFLCPILLSRHNIVDLLIRETHEKCGHMGTQVVMNTLREKFWIISLRQLIKTIASKCIICKRQKSKFVEGETPPLPLNRVRDAIPFESTGVDFAGPVFIKGGKKGWICIFTCAVYRAVHFELASSLSAEEFVECLRRFIARRGRPRNIYSDNGTNFRGTANALRNLNWEKVRKGSSAFEIEWHVNPPAAPWWGGWWERLVDVMKTILRKTLGKACLSYESLTTALCDAEAVINSRPMTYVSDDTSDLKPLSPSMFIQEMREVGVPDLDKISKEKLNRKMKHRQQVLKDIRARIRVEYLSQLLLRNEKEETRKIKIGDIVLIGSDNVKRMDWPLGRIVETIAGRDGVVRVCILKTKNRLLKRPIQRIYPLEISANESVDGGSMTLNQDLRRGEEENFEYCNLNEDDLDSEANKIVTTKSVRMIKKPDRLKY